MNQQTWTDITVSARDGLRLHARAYGDRASPHLPVLCLAGLTRNASDFHELATRLANDPAMPRYVLCLDGRGRGQSQWDKDWRNYSAPVEADDALQLLTACGIGDVLIVGTSRGGILTMLIACMRPGILAGAVLNDVGPQIEGRGLARLKNYVGRLPQPENWEQAAGIVQDLFKAKFPALSAPVWRRYAQGTFSEKDGRLVPSYDPALAKPLAGIDLADTVPTMWPQFMALGKKPVLILRGENSDILSRETLARMHEMHPALQSHIVPGQGHAPWLGETALCAMVAKFLNAAERSSGH